MAGQVASLTDVSGTVGYGYDTAGELTSIGRPNGVNTAYTYDSAGNVTSIDHTTPSGDRAARGGYGVELVDADAHHARLRAELLDARA